MRIQLFCLALAAATTLPLPASAMSPEDKAVARRIATNLEESGQLQGYRVGVKCQEGTAWLSGTVSDLNQLKAAINITKSTEGVSKIVNKLQLTSQGGQPASPEVRLASNATLPRTVTQTPRATHPASPVQQAGHGHFARRRSGMPVPVGHMPTGSVRPVSHDAAVMPGYAWPSYAAAPNYAALTYPKQYSPAAWPYIGPFYPYPQVPLGWRKVTLEWDDGWWMLDFKE